jgi:phosphoenolpyruvate carboxykinase (diphosphate)
VRACFGKVFDNPAAVLDEAMLRPETQDMAAFVDGVDNICAAQKRVAQGYFRDGSIQDACPPLVALLHIMVDGHYQGQGIDSAVVRDLFTADYLLQSDWYRERLTLQQARDVQLWHKHRYYLVQQLDETPAREVSLCAELEERVRNVENMLRSVSSPEYLERLRGTLGTDRVHRS